MSREVLDRIEGSDSLFIFWCPGCGCAHYLDTTRWKWNGDMVKPTATPSLLLRPQPSSNDFNCHFFIKDGQIRYLNDCTHKLKGQTVAMTPLDNV